MKLEIEFIPGEINIENADKCKISRCIYHFQDSCVDTYCLIRIFEFTSKTIVIASQILGITGGNRHLIKNIIEYFNLDCENLYWINHDGFFSCYMSEEEFIHTVFFNKKNSLFSQKEIEIIEERKISIEVVEKLIDSSLKPVESWLGLDSRAENRFRRAREERTFELLYWYLKDNIEHLYKQKEIIEILGQSRPGAIFFYPNQSRKFEFIDYTELLNCSDNSRRKSLTYINKSFPDKEIVICVCIDNYDPFCAIFRKDFFVNPAKINSYSIEKLVECEIESSDTVKFDVDRYCEKIELGKERLESLLQLYLEPKSERLKSVFEQMESARSKLETQRGALFYYPEHNQCLFYFKQELTSAFEKLAVPYVDKYDVETQMVICFSIFNELSVCGIFPKF